METFEQIYERHLIRMIETRPDDYAYPLAEVPLVVMRMMGAIRRNGFNANSPALRATAKELGIKPTATAIRAYVLESEVKSNG